MKRRLFVALTLSLMAAAAAAAQTGSVRLTLDEAVSRGLATSDRLDELGARQEGARAVEDQRKAAGRPQLAARGSYIRTNHVDEFSVPTAVPGVRLLIYPDLPNNLQTGVDLQWPIYTAGRVSGLTRAAGAEVEAAGHDRDAARADLKLEITRSFWAVIT
ncbi:MAG TPA: TolC family protein, partial [Vicinamibacterales bacterium]|nr:TolC family protein [Vicinamibacterales bacterium]